MYQYYYVMEYLPTRYEADSSEWENRHEVWNFKDGHCSTRILNRIIEFIEKETSCENKSDYVICFIPASSKIKTRNRYSFLANELTKRTGIKATLEAIIKTTDTESGHLCGKSLDPTADYIFNANLFKGYKVILIDDIITRGRTFKDTTRKLISNGAIDVTGIFVGKTVNL